MVSIPIPSSYHGPQHRLPIYALLHLLRDLYWYSRYFLIHGRLSYNILHHLHTHVVLILWWYRWWFRIWFDIWLIDPCCFRWRFHIWITPIVISWITSITVESRRTHLEWCMLRLRFFDVSSCGLRFVYLSPLAQPKCTVQRARAQVDRHGVTKRTRLRARHFWNR